jgi:hypothetical protein
MAAFMVSKSFKIQDLTDSTASQANSRDHTRRIILPTYGMIFTHLQFQRDCWSMGIRLPNGVGVDDDAEMNEQIMAIMAAGGSKRSVK